MIEGRMENGEIVLSGEDYTAGTLVRGCWKPEKSNVRESAVTSTDGRFAIRTSGRVYDSRSALRRECLELGVAGQAENGP
jgi:hypothetical protein